MNLPEAMKKLFHSDQMSTEIVHDLTRILHRLAMCRSQTHEQRCQCIDVRSLGVIRLVSSRVAILLLRMTCTSPVFQSCSCAAEVRSYSIIHVVLPTRQLLRNCSTKFYLNSKFKTSEGRKTTSARGVLWSRDEEYWFLNMEK